MRMWKKRVIALLRFLICLIWTLYLLSTKAC